MWSTKYNITRAYTEKYVVAKNLKVMPCRCDLTSLACHIAVGNEFVNTYKALWKTDYRLYGKKILKSMTN